MQWRVIPAADGYPGLTALKVDDRREIVSRGTGPAVEAAILRKKEEAR